MSAALAVGISLTGLFVALAWAAGRPAWAGSSLIRIRANTALVLFLSGGGVWLSLYPRKRLAVVGCRAVAAVALLLSTLTGLEILFDIDFGIDLMLVPAGAATGRMGWAAVVSSVLLCSGILLVSARRRIAVVTGQGLAVLAEIHLLPTLLAFSYGISTQTGVFNPQQMAPLATILFALLGVAILGVRSRAGIAGVFLRGGHIAAISRRFLLSMLVLVPVLGWIMVGVARQWHWEAEFSIAALTVAAILTLTVVIGMTAVHSLGHEKRRYAAERDRARLVAQIQEQNNQLELTVALRTAALRQANAELERTAAEAQRLAMVASHTTNAVAVTDAESCVVWINEGLTRITGFGLDDLCGRRLSDLLYGPETDPQAAALMQESLAAGRGHGDEILNYTKDRKPIWLRVDSQPVYAPDGVLQGFIVVASDITGGVKQREELRVSEERLKLATGALDMGVWDWQVDGTIVWDDGMLRLFGMSREEFEESPRKWTQFLHPDDSAVLARMIEFSRVGGARDDLEYRIIRRNGDVRHIRAGTVAVHTGGHRNRMIGINLDITAERQLDAALRDAKEAAELASRAKSELVAMMSHEIRTPMNGVIGFTDLLRDSPLTPDQRDWVNTIRTSGDALLSVINDILDFSKIESGQMDVDPTPTSLPALVRDVVALVVHSAHTKSIAVSSRLSPEVPSWILVDCGRLRQILLNVTANAIKFTDHGSVEIRVDVEDGRLVFLVTDTGPGIPPGRAAELFQPFRQLDSSAARRRGGTGLGLVISRRLCQLLGGDIAVASTSAAGTVFRFDLPIEICAEPQRPADPVADVTGPTGQGRRARVLVAEDNAVNQRVIAMMLSRAGYSTTIVSDGIECLETLRTSAFDLILMDCHMPNLDGYETTRRIRSGDAGFGVMSIPILALTASVMEREREICREAGMDDFLTKPIHTKELVSAIERVCPAGPVA